MEESEEKSEPTDSVVRIIQVTTLDPQDQVVKLTPTGRVSHAKSRVYTQRYRKEWEQMPDFKGWLTSVPYEVTRAYCKYCDRNLHAHRLSLLKHMCTLKHNRAAVLYSTKQQLKKNDKNLNMKKNDKLNDEENEMDESVDETIYIKEIVEDEETEYREEEEEVVEEEEEDEEEEMNMESTDTEQIMEVSENEIIESNHSVKKETSQKQQKQDTLAQAMAHVTSDFITDGDNIQLEMTVESEVDNNDENGTQMYQIESQETYGKNKNTIVLDGKVQKNVNINDRSIKSGMTSEKKNILIPADSSKQLYLISADGKSYSIVKSLPQLLINPKNEKILNSLPKSAKNATNDATVKATTSLEAVNKKNTNITCQPKKPSISTHVIDTSKGIPISGLQVILYKLNDGKWNFVHESTTSANGICNDFSKSDSKSTLSTGRYKLHYDVEKYYSTRKIATVYPFIEIVFDIKDPLKSYHVPLLLTPYSYSTYRDTLR